MREFKSREADAVVGAHGVLAGSITTGLSVTLVNVQAHGEVCGSLESVVTETAVAALGVDTLAMATHIGDLLALITIYAGSTRGQFEPW